MTTKKFLNWALIFNVVTSLLSVLFSFIFFEASGILSADDDLLSLISYIKKFFDLLAVFTGYGTIMYAFSRYGFDTGVKATGIFSISVLISFIWQVAGSQFGIGAEFISDSLNQEIGADFFFYSIFFFCGYCFITQFLPGLFIAIITHYLTRKSTNKKTLFRLRLIATITLLLINILIITFSNVIPFAEYYGWVSLPSGGYWTIVLMYVEVVVLYGFVQFGMYYLTHYLYNKYTDHTQYITTSSQNKRKKKSGALNKKDKATKADEDNDASEADVTEESKSSEEKLSKGSKNNKRKIGAK